MKEPKRNKFIIELPVIMKRHFLKLFLFFLITSWSFTTKAQSSFNDSLKIDSVKKRLQTQKEDSNKVNSLNDLSATALAREDFDNSMQYAREALAISEKLNYNKGKADAYL